MRIVFRAGSLHQIENEGVKAILESCLDWESTRPVRAAQLSHCTHSLIQGYVDALPIFSLEEIWVKQRTDSTLARVIFFVDRKRRPSRRERERETMRPHQY